MSWLGLSKLQRIQRNIAYGIIPAVGAETYPLSTGHEMVLL